MPRRSGSSAGLSTARLPCLEAAELSEESLAKKLQEALLLAKLEDFQREGVKALPLSATSCAIEFHQDVQTAFTVVDIATHYDFCKLSSLEVDERNAQQFVEQLGPGKRPLWAVPVILRPKNAGLVLVFACVFRESGSVRSHLAKNSALKELKHWTLRNSKELQVTFWSSDAGQQLLLGGPELATKQMPRVEQKPCAAGGPTAESQRAERELVMAEEKEKAKQLKRKVRPVVSQAVEVATSPGSEASGASEESEVAASEEVADVSNRASILELLSGWLGSIRAEESCHKVVNANYWHYRRNENACWRLSYLQAKASPLCTSLSTSSMTCGCSDHGDLCSCMPNPWKPLPELEPDGREPQLLLAAGGMTVEPPGLEPELSDTSLWRHLLRGTHGFSLHGPAPVSLYPEAPELARTARLRQQNAGWRRWWLSWKKAGNQQAADAAATPVDLGATPMVLMPLG